MNITDLYTNVLYLGCILVILYIISHYECYKKGYITGRYGRKYNCNDYYKMIFFIFVIGFIYYLFIYLRK